MLIAKLGLAALAERVAIGDDAVEIDGRRAELDLAHLLFGERLGETRLDGEAVASGIDGALAVLWLTGLEAVGGIEHLGLRPVAHAMRRRLAEIPHGALEERPRPRLDAGDEGFARTEIGAELRPGEIRGAGDEIARGEPQKDGGKREHQRDGGDDVLAILGEEAR